MLKISVVTISYNQAEFLERCIQSVVRQDYPNLEYIIVDPGSTDGSREIIKKYEKVFSHILLEPDNGPADGLNKGFAKATGDLFYFINSDDIVLPGAFKTAVRYFENDAGLDVLLGNGLEIDKQDNVMRKILIDKFDHKGYVYGANIIFQQSFFFTRKAFEAIRGFNAANKVSWDSELLIDFALHRRTFKKSSFCFGAIRSYGTTITEQIRTNEKFRMRYLENNERMFEKVMKRPRNKIDSYRKYYYFAMKVVNNPHNLLKVFKPKKKIYAQASSTITR